MARSERTDPADPEGFMAAVIERMERYQDAETLNENVITPFARALETVCAARGYLLNIYGERSNVVVAGPEDAEVIYQLVEAYLDDTGRG